MKRKIQKELDSIEAKKAYLAKSFDERINDEVISKKQPLAKAKRLGEKLIGAFVYDESKEKTIWQPDAYIGKWDEETQRFIKVNDSRYMDQEDKRRMNKNRKT